MHANKFNPRYEIIWWMVAGLLKEDEAHLEAFFDCLKQAPRDLAGLNQQLLQLRCLEECQLNIDENKKTTLLKELVLWINYEMVAGEKYEFHFIATYLGMSPQVFQQKWVEQWFAASLNETYRVRGSLSMLANQRHFPLGLMQPLVALLSDPEERVRAAAAHVLSEQKALPDRVLQQLEALFCDPEKQIRKVAAWALGEQKTLPESVLQQMVALLSDPGKRVREATVWPLGEQKALPESVLQQLNMLLSDPEEEVREDAALVLRKQSILPIEILKNLRTLAMAEAQFAIWAIEKLSIEYLIENIKEHLLSANLTPLLRLLFLKSHQQKLPIYFVDSKQASGKVTLCDTQSELHVCHLWQDTFTYQQKQVFTKTFHQVFFEMTGMLPELSSAKLQMLKNQLAGQMLSQARALFQFISKAYPVNCIADKKIVSRILFFTPAGPVLDNSQQEKNC